MIPVTLFIGVLALCVAEFVLFLCLFLYTHKAKYRTWMFSSIIVCVTAYFVLFVRVNGEASDIF